MLEGVIEDQAFALLPVHGLPTDGNTGCISWIGHLQGQVAAQHSLVWPAVGWEALVGPEHGEEGGAEARDAVDDPRCVRAALAVGLGPMAVSREEVGLP